MKVGDVYPTKYWGNVEVLETVGYGCDCLVRFLKSGNEKRCRKTEVKKGNLRDREAHDVLGVNKSFPNRQSEATPPINVGVRFPSNFWGDVEVLEYKSNKEVVVRFVDSGNVCTVQKTNLKSGLIKDTELCTAQYKAANDAERAVKDFQRRSEEYPSLLKRINKKISVAHKQAHKLWSARQREVDKIFNTFSQVFTHPKYGDYRIDSISKDGSCTVKFLLTGYIHSCMLLVAKRGRVRDYSQFSKEGEKAVYREKNATSYLENREVRLQQAKDWQKANPEKSRVRNRNRRAKRINAEGTHTEAQTTALLELQDHKCNSCGICLHTAEKHLDHIMPLDLGGSNWLDNLQWLCQFCNNSKGAKHPDEWAAEILTEHWQARRQQRLQAVL